MDVTFKTADQVAELLGEPFDLPGDAAYMASCQDGQVLIAVDEINLLRLLASVALSQVCEALTRLIAESQHYPGVPVVYGPHGVERRSRVRLRAVS